MNYKVFIPTAGIGSRVGENFGKALLSIGNRPVICRMIDKFEKDVEIVIALGYCGDYIKQTLDMFYPKRKITYIWIDPYEGEGSGLGLTFLQCKDQLQCPFVFCCCDTIVTEPIPIPEFNWMGYAKRQFGGTKLIPLGNEYRSLKLSNDIYIKEICSKNAKGDYPYIGLAGIYDYQIFWDKMEEGKDVGSIEMGEVFGLKYLLDKPIHAKKFTWYDTGTKYSLAQTRTQLKLWLDPCDARILPKDNEAIWFTNIEGQPGRHVIKFSTDKQFIRNRVKRSNRYLYGYTPFVDNFY